MSVPETSLDGDRPATAGELSDALLQVAGKCQELQRQLDAAHDALRRAQKLVGLLTVRQVIEAGDEAIDAAGLNPYCMNEGLAEGHERIGAHFIDAALGERQP